MKRMLSLSIVTVALLGTVACSNSYSNATNANIGMATGAVAGGVIGGQFGVAPAIGGALVGGYVGRQAGKSWNSY